MSDFNDSMAEALEDMGETFGESFVYKGVSYIGIKNEIEFEMDLMNGGQLAKLGMMLVVSKRQMRSKPNVGELLLIEGVLFRIEKVKSDEVSWEFQCVTAAV